MSTIDFSALTAPVTKAEVTAFRQSARTRPEYSTTSGAAAIIVAVAVLAIFGFVVLSFVGGIITYLASATEGSVSPVGLVFPAVFIVIFVIVAIAIARTLLRGGAWERWLRLDRFAAANGLVFSPTGVDPQYPGAIFQLGRNRTAVDHLRSASGRFLDYGNYRYVTGSGKNQTTHNWGFLALQLDRALPNMVLDSKANNGLFGGSNLPATFSKDQILHLEGDFDEYFTLYCPKEYERDALYVFTPDLMALLIDNASPFDVEIVDKWMFVYSSAALDLRQPAVHQRLLGIVDTVGAKTLTQTDRYTDERVGNPTANVVAPQGQRLKRGVSVGAIILVVVFAAFWAWPLVADLIFGN
ncbi:MAG: hypothetical protein JWR04_685 [Rhodoglobus sp.]|nr:hypothetical protein [Rhodoglobus sp.]